jgi:ubiquinone/menaquinone biosynthesis C-methylase UbiE
VRLTQLTGLHHLVDFRLGNALDMPFEDASFDAVIGEEAWCHVPEKHRLIAECARVLKPGGVIAFTDILRRGALDSASMGRLAQEMSYAPLETLDGYSGLLRQHGCTVLSAEDLSELWSRILLQRLEMYRSLKDDTIRKFGEAHYRDWDNTYSFFVGLYSAGKLGGGRFVARRDA